MAFNKDLFTFSDNETSVSGNQNTSALNLEMFPQELVIVSLSLDIEPRRRPLPTPTLHSSSPWYFNASFPDFSPPLSPSIWDNDSLFSHEDPDMSGMDNDALDDDSDAETEPGCDPIYVDNGDRGVTYIAQFGRNYSLYFEMTPNHPNERCPRMNRRRPLWGDRFDMTEDKENAEHDEDRDTYVFEQSPVLIRRPFEPNWTRTRNLPSPSCRCQMWSTVRACLFHNTNPILDQIQNSEECEYFADGNDSQNENTLDEENQMPETADFCINFHLGDCNFGDRCSFSHDATRFPF